MDSERLYKIIEASALFEDAKLVSIKPFTSDEDGTEYGVWLLSDQKLECVLKRSKGEELPIYEEYLAGSHCAPKLLSSVNFCGEDYIFLEYIKGNNLLKASREAITRAVDAIADIQERYWQVAESGVGISFEKSLESRLARGKYLLNPLFNAEYERFLECYKSLPRALSHDDLLPFNVIFSEEENRAVIVDWEHAGILPYPTPLARLLAHADEDNAFFYMKNEDKEFAVAYYYERLIKKKGISFADYKNALDLFVFYEYCEWIMLGNKYKDADMKRFFEYSEKAKKHIKGAK